MPLKISYSCEIDNLIDEIVSKTKKDYDAVESALFSLHIYPENTKTFLMRDQNGQILSDVGEYHWLENALRKIFNEANINEIYITLAI